MSGRTLCVCIDESDPQLWSISNLCIQTDLQASVYAFKENFYVVPSSVHEMTIVPESFAGTENADRDVKRKPRDTGTGRRYRSDHVYYYDRKEIDCDYKRSEEQSMQK